MNVLIIFFVNAIGGPQSAVIPSLYRPGVVFSELESWSS
jgi:hypothetical protein